MNDLLVLISTLPRARAILVSMVLSAVYYLMFFDGGERIQNQINTAQSEVQRIQAELVEANKKMEEVRVLKAAQEKDAEKLNFLLGFIPEKLSKVDLMRTVSSEVKAVGANLLSLTDLSKVESGDLYEEMSIDVQISGTYAQFMMFLANLTKLSNIVTVSKVKIGGSSGPAKTVEGPLMLNLSATIKGYRYKGESQATTPKKAGG